MASLFSPLISSGLLVHSRQVVLLAVALSRCNYLHVEVFEVVGRAVLDTSLRRSLDLWWQSERKIPSPTFSVSVFVLYGTLTPRKG